MTKDEFIDGYVARTNECHHKPAAVRTAEGFQMGSYRYRAMRCACGDRSCDGWAMVKDSPEAIALQDMLYSPDATS